jgi:hypothetical protein
MSWLEEYQYLDDYLWLYCAFLYLSSTSGVTPPTRHSLRSARDEDSWLCLSMELCLDRCLSWSREDPSEFAMLSSVVLGCTGKSMTSGQAPYVSAVWQSRRVCRSSGMKCTLFYASGIKTCALATHLSSALLMELCLNPGGLCHRFFSAVLAYSL